VVVVMVGVGVEGGVEVRGRQPERRRRQNARCKKQDARCRRQDAGGKKQDAGCKKQDAGCKKQDAGCKKQDAGCKKQDARCGRLVDLDMGTLLGICLKTAQGGPQSAAGLPPTHRWENAQLVPVCQRVFRLPDHVVDKDDLDLIGGETQVLDQVPHRRPLRQFHRHRLADPQVGVVPAKDGE
jgi:hypothetical protein